MAYDFDAATLQKFTLSAAPVTAEPLTLACWFKKVEVTTTQRIFQLRDAAGNARWQLSAAGATVGDPLQAFSVDAANSTAASSANGIIAGQWHHGAGVFSAANARQAWLDGTFGASNALSRTVSGVNEVSVGAETFTGAIAEAAIWNVALTQEDIQALARGFSPRRVRPTALMFYAPLIRASLDLRSGPLTPSATPPTVADHPRRIG